MISSESAYVSFNPFGHTVGIASLYTIVYNDVSGREALTRIVCTSMQGRIRIATEDIGNDLTVEELCRG